MGDGRAEGSSAIGDGGQAAVSLTPDVDGTHVCIFESSQLEVSYVGGLLCLVAVIHQQVVFKEIVWVDLLRLIICAQSSTVYIG